MNRLYAALVLGLVMSACGSDSDSDTGKESDSKKPKISEKTAKALNGTNEGKGGVMIGGTFSYAQDEMFGSLFPSSIVDLTSFQIAGQIHEGLMRYDPRTMELLNGIADSVVESDNRQEYTFYLRKGVHFHDDPCFENGKGREVKAADVKFSFELLCAGENTEAKSNYQSIFKDAVVGAENYHNGIIDEISGIIVLDDYTIKIQLLSPLPSFLYKLGVIPTAIIPQEAYEKYGSDMKVGVGPFKYGRFSENDGVLLVRNPNYYRKDVHGNQLPYLDTVHFRFIEKRTEQLEMFENGDLSVIHKLPADKVSEIIEENYDDYNRNPPPPEKSIVRGAELVTQYYGFNLTRRHFKDPRVRKAFNYAIDRKRLIENILRNQANEYGQYGITPPVLALQGYPFDSLEQYGYQYDPEKAKQLMAEAGYPNGKGFPTIDLEVNSGGDAHNRIAKEVVKQLESVLGIHVNQEVVSFAQKLEDSKYGRADIFRAAWVADYPDPETFLNNFYGKNVPASLDKPSHPNTTRYVNKAFDASFEKGRMASERKERFQHFMEAEKIMMKDAPIIVLWYEENYKLQYTYVRNFHANPLEHLDLSEVYFKPWSEKEWMAQFK